MRERGFTLVELALTITIIAILAWVAYPKVAAMGEIRLDAAARRLAGDLRYAQSRSIGTHAVHGVHFEPARSRYTVYSPTPASPVTDPADRARPLRVDYTSRVEFHGIAITSAAFGATPSVSFDYYGAPRDGSGNDLAAAGRVILSYQGLSDTVLVAPGTGAVTVR
jgi:prepilin-type N-terminal cleavage/methylation domain-containing protein